VVGGSRAGLGHQPATRPATRPLPQYIERDFSVPHGVLGQAIPYGQEKVGGWGLATVPFLIFVSLFNLCWTSIDRI